MRKPLIVNQEQFEAYLISHADKKSRAPPILPPNVAAMTGFGQSAIAFKGFWSLKIIRRRAKALRPMSSRAITSPSSPAS